MRWTSADRGMAWVREHLVEHDDWTALADNGRAPTGGAALLAAGLVERRELTGDTTNDDLLRRLGRFLVAQTDPSGAVIAQYSTDRFEPDVESRSKYYTGEAYWAIARLHRLFPDDGFGAVADRVGNYLATERDDIEGYWPPIPDHWVAYGLAETVMFPERDPDQPLTAAELAYARSQASLFGGQVRWVSQQAGPWGRLVRGGHVVRGGGYGVLGEALTGLWRVAEADSRMADLRVPIAQRAACIAGLAQDVQRSEPADPRADGAWFVRGVTRMDDQQHATSALLRTKAIVDADSLSGTDDAPSGWLWAVALVATFNPFFVGLALPRRETSKERAGLAAVGGALGSLIVVAAALFSGPLLDALDVSRAAARVAIGIVGAGAGLVRMFRRLPSAQPAPGDLERGTGTGRDPLRRDAGADPARLVGGCRPRRRHRGLVAGGRGGGARRQGGVAGREWAGRPARGLGGPPPRCGRRRDERAARHRRRARRVISATTARRGGGGRCRHARSATGSPPRARSR